MERINKLSFANNKEEKFRKATNMSEKFYWMEEENDGKKIKTKSLEAEKFKL